jgi:hypothetical protein
MGNRKRVSLICMCGDRKVDHRYSSGAARCGFHHLIDGPARGKDFGLDDF